MEYQKLDPGLIDALEEAEETARTFNVFVGTEPVKAPDQLASLERSGIPAPEPGGTVHTGQVTQRAIDSLSSEPWVRSITLGRQLHPLG